MEIFGEEEAREVEVAEKSGGDGTSVEEPEAVAGCAAGDGGSKSFFKSLRVGMATESTSVRSQQGHEMLPGLSNFNQDFTQLYTKHTQELIKIKILLFILKF